jgi:hypothetical protein
MMADITWEQLENKQKLDDGDKIAVQVHEHTCEPSQIEIALKLGPGRTWWKGLQAYEIVLCQCQDNQSYSLTRINLEDVLARQFVFWKAKFGGVHTPMYSLSDTTLHDKLKGGNTYLFEWLEDA